jgi:hypothetical protein
MSYLTTDDKRDLAIIGGISAIIVFIYLFTPAQAASPNNLPQTVLQNPQGGTVNNYEVPPMSQLNLPMFPDYVANQSSNKVTPNQQLCGCGCDPTDQTSLYNNEQDLANEYMTKESALYQKYVDQVSAALPSFVKQYVSSADGYIASLSGNTNYKGAF